MSDRNGARIPVRLLSRSALALLLGATAPFGLAGCATSSDAPGAVRVGDQPSSLIDSYLFIRGMALSYTHSGRAGPAEVAQLIGYDHAALLAVMAAQLDPAPAKRGEARRALQAMLSYAETRDMEPLPAPDSPLAAASRTR